MSNIPYQLEQSLQKEQPDPNGPRLKFYQVPFGLPHTKRAMEILEKHPEIGQLQGQVAWQTKWYILLTVILQTCIAAFIADQHWSVFVLTAYFVGATCHQSIFVGVHELSHFTSAKSHFWCRVHSMVANLPIGIPFSSSFDAYHYDHHRFLAHEDNDTDVPTEYEAYFFTHYFGMNYCTRVIGKALFMFFQILFYALRPLVVKPDVIQRIRFSPYYLANTFFCLGYDLVLIQYFGIWAWIYLILSTFFGGSIHPLSGHFLSEHYIFEQPEEGQEGYQETFSYYGVGNLIMYNVGYHHEHHDFPNIPWTLLPKVSEIASEYYKPFRHHTSWTKCVFDYIFDDRVSPFSRVRREHKKYLLDDTAPIPVVGVAKDSQEPAKQVHDQQ